MEDRLCLVELLSMSLLLLSPRSWRELSPMRRMELPLMLRRRLELPKTRLASLKLGLLGIGEVLQDLLCLELSS